MRRSIAARFLLASLLTAPLALADCPQLVTNGGFDSGDAAGWSHFTKGYFYEYDVIEDPFNDGNYVLSLDHSEDEEELDIFDAGLTQQVTLVAGARYRLAFWAYGDDLYTSDVIDGSSPGHVSIRESDGASASLGLAQDFNWLSNEGYGENYSFEFEATAGGNGQLTFFFGSDDVWIVIDNIVLEEISSSTCPAVGGNGNGGATGDGDGDATGDGDGDATGDGDGDATGDGDGNATGDGDGDGNATGDGDGDGNATGDGDGDGDATGDGDGDATGDGDGDGDAASGGKRRKKGGCSYDPQPQTPSLPLVWAGLLGLGLFVRRRRLDRDLLPRGVKL